MAQPGGDGAEGAAPLQDWVIVGGGIHGVHVALRLIAEAGVERERLCLVDPAERLLARWRECTEVTGMAYLRSPIVHHLGPGELTLERFVQGLADQPPGLFAEPYDRPYLGLFNSHSEHLIQSFGLEERHVQGRVERCSVGDEGVLLELSGGQRLASRRVVLALGASEEPHWPAWAPRGDARVQHVFTPGFDGWPTDGAERVAVVGGGITAAQVAIRLAADGHGVRLVSRHPIREHQFDAEPGWFGPKYMTGFRRTRDYGERRAQISTARHTGSIPPDVHQALCYREDRGEVDRVEAGIEELTCGSDGVRVQLSTGAELEVERVLLATGFTRTRPGGRLVDDLRDSASLRCAPCGYPIVDRALRWHPRVHVTGPLAELELGPVARNIAGASRAADRIVGWASGTRGRALRASAS